MSKSDRKACPHCDGLGFHGDVLGYRSVCLECWGTGYVLDERFKALYRSLYEEENS